MIFYWCYDSNSVGGSNIDSDTENGDRAKCGKIIFIKHEEAEDQFQQNKTSNILSKNEIEIITVPHCWLF